MKRLFCFGCSFTKYEWPTWADIIAHNLDIEYYNYGGQGLGNYAILCLLVEANLRHTFTNNDLIFIGWSGWNREDKFIKKNNGWSIGQGNVLHKHYYDDNYIQKYWSEENDIIRNATSIIAANKMFNITHQHTVFDIDYNSDVFEFYKDSLPDIDMCWQKEYNYPFTPFNGKTAKIKQYADPHPDILSHLAWATRILDKLQITVSNSTKDYFVNMQTSINEMLDLVDTDPTNDNFYNFFKNTKSVLVWDQGLDNRRLSM